MEMEMETDSKSICSMNEKWNLSMYMYMWFYAQWTRVGGVEQGQTTKMNKEWYMTWGHILHCLKLARKMLCFCFISFHFIFNFCRAKFQNTYVYSVYTHTHIHTYLLHTSKKDRALNHLSCGIISECVHCVINSKQSLEYFPSQF